MSCRHMLALSLAVEALKAEPPKRWKPERTARVIELLKEVASLLPAEEPEPEGCEIDHFSGEAR